MRDTKMKQKSIEMEMLQHPLISTRKISTVTAPDTTILSEEAASLSPNIYRSRHETDYLDANCSNNRRSKIPDAVLIFAAVNKLSLPSLRKLLETRPDLANCHGGSFHITPLHLSVEHNWKEGITELLKSGASVFSKNQYGQTPLHYAAAQKSVNLLPILLSGSNCSFIDSKDLRGVTPLHDAAAAGCIKKVTLLLKLGSDCSLTDINGQTPLHKATKCGAIECAAALMRAGGDLLHKDDRGVTPKRYLSEHPVNLEKLLDVGIVTSVNRVSGFPLTFDFSLLVAPYGIQQCRLLQYFAESDHSYLLAHPLCHTLLLVKWRKTRIVFLLYMLLFSIFSALTYALLFSRYVQIHCRKMNSSNYTENNYTNGDTNTTNLDTTNINSTGIKSASTNSTSTEQTLQKIECAIADNILSVKIAMLFLIFLFFVGQLNRLRNHAKSCVKSMTWWLLLIILILSTVIVCVSWVTPVQHYYWEHHLATVLIMLQGTQILHLLSKFPSLGIYWLMFIRVAEMFLRVFFIYLCLLLSFTMTFYVALSDEKSTTFNSFGLTFLKSLTMMVGELDLSDLKSDLDSLPFTSHVLLVLFILLVSIILANLLVALAVSDINGLRSIAHLMRLASMVEAVVSIEQLWDCPVLKYLPQMCYLPTRDIQFRLWPRMDQRHPKVIVKLNEAAVQSYPSIPYSKRRSWFVYFTNKLRSNQYSVEISTCVLENLLDRLDVKEGNCNSRLSVKFRCFGNSGGGRKISAAEMVSRRRHTLCKSGSVKRTNSKRLKIPSQKTKKILDSYIDPNIYI